MKDEILFLSFSLLLGCQIIPPSDKYRYDKIYIDSIKVSDTIKFNQKFTVEIYGTYPTPGWELYKYEIKETESEIEITPIARIRKDIIVPQVLTPFKLQLELLNNKEIDSVKIIVVGKTSKIEKTVTVAK